MPASIRPRFPDQDIFLGSIDDRWIAAWQGEDETCATVAPVLGANRAAMRFDDGAADCQAEADARCGAFLLAALEFLEYLFFLALRQARAVVLYPYVHQVAGARRSADSNGASPRGVFGGVFQQVRQHALYQHSVELEQGQVLGQIDADAMVGDGRANRL